MSRRTRTGLSLSEVLISLAISATLLTAIAAAFQSSTSVIENNQKFFRASQSARVALNQIVTEVRRADALVDRDTVITTGPSGPFTVQGINANRLPIFRPAETRLPQEMVRIYRYDPATQRLLLSFQDDDGTLSPEYPLAENVQSSPFSWDVGTDANNSDCVARVAVALDVKVGDNNVRLSGSVAPRRSLTYK